MAEGYGFFISPTGQVMLDGPTYWREDGAMSAVACSMMDRIVHADA